SEQRGALCGPISRAASAVFLAGDDNQWRAMLSIFHRGVVNAHSFAIGLIFGYAAFGAGDHQIFDADVSESSASHDSIVTATRAVAVEVLESDPMIEQIFTGGRGFLDAAGRRNVVGSDAVAENSEWASAFDFDDLAGLQIEV